MKLDSRKTGFLDIFQMKKFFIQTVTGDNSVWSEMFSIFNLEDKHVLISYPVSLLLNLALS
jgi:hypothetical protein